VPHFDIEPEDRNTRDPYAHLNFEVRRDSGIIQVRGGPKFKVETRAGNVRVAGYINKFNTLSLPIPVKNSRSHYRERIAPGAFKSSLASGRDIGALLRHNMDAVLGRTANGTFQLCEDSQGLRFTLDLPPTTLGADVRGEISHGTLTSCSFGFGDAVDQWEDGDDMPLRIVTDMRLVEGSLVTWPAYTDSSVALAGDDAEDDYDAPLQATGTNGRSNKLYAAAMEMGVPAHIARAVTRGVFPPTRVTTSADRILKFAVMEMGMAPEDARRLLPTN
jgi:HK97 family phage prohead protease